MIGTIVTFMFRNDFSSLATSRYLSCFLDFLYFYSQDYWNGKINKLTFFSCQLKLSLVFQSGLGDRLVNENPTEFSVSCFLGEIPACKYIIFQCIIIIIIIIIINNK